MSRPVLRATLAFAALAVAGGAFLSISPAAAASAGRATYCLSGDSRSDCGFASLAQCEATAAGGLGECSAATFGTLQRDPDTLDGVHGKFHRPRG